MAWKGREEGEMMRFSFRGDKHGIPPPTRMLPPAHHHFPVSSPRAALLSSYVVRVNRNHVQQMRICIICVSAPAVLLAQ